jgi:hypothetical protein
MVKAGHGGFYAKVGAGVDELDTIWWDVIGSVRDLHHGN